MEYPIIQVESLGRFKAQKNKLPYLIVKHKKHLEVLTKDTFSQMQLRKELNDKLAKVLRLQALLNKERARRHRFMIEHGRYKENMEKSAPDPRRSH